MQSLVEKTKSQRKTFTIPSYIVKELEEYSKTSKKKQSQVIAIALEEYLHKKNRLDKVKKRLDILEGLVGILPEGSTKDKKIQDILGK